METIRVETKIKAGKLRIEVDSALPEGPAEVVLVVQSLAAPTREVHWDDFIGLGKKLWDGEDAQDYVNRLRDEWER